MDDLNTELAAFLADWRKQSRRSWVKRWVLPFLEILSPFLLCFCSAYAALAASGLL